MQAEKLLIYAKLEIVKLKYFKVYRNSTSIPWVILSNFQEVNN